MAKNGEGSAAGLQKPTIKIAERTRYFAQRQTDRIFQGLDPAAINVFGPLRNMNATVAVPSSITAGRFELTRRNERQTK